MSRQLRFFEYVINRANPVPYSKWSMTVNKNAAHYGAALYAFVLE